MTTQVARAISNDGPDALRSVGVAEFEQLAHAVDAATRSIDAELAGRLWVLADPERRKALSRARDFSQQIRERLDAKETASFQDLPVAATVAVATRVARISNASGRENAWDFAEELRAVSWAYLPDEALTSLLEKEKSDTTSLSWKAVFGDTAALEELLQHPSGFRGRALERLRRLHRERVDRVRHDRARDKLWQQFAWRLIPVGYALLAACLLLMKEPPYLGVFAGAIGSVLSAVIKLRDGEHRIRLLRRAETFVLLQPMIGAIAALALIWLGVENVLKLELAYAIPLIGFLAGFSEPFFIGTLARLSEPAGSDQGSPQVRKKANG